MEQVKKELPEYVQRMKVELSELTEKIGKLRDFLSSPLKCGPLPEAKKRLMDKQVRAMLYYAEILEERLELELDEHQAL